MLSTPQKLPVLRLLTPGLDFLRPYINAELSDIYDIIYDDSTTPDTTLAIVREGEEKTLDKKVINTLLITFYPRFNRYKIKIVYLHTKKYR